MLDDYEPAVATYSLPSCEGCGIAPQGMVSPSSHAAALLPLLSPPPMSPTLRAATSPRSMNRSIMPRCAQCLKERHCHCCNKWWCESCYELPGQVAHAGTSIDAMEDNWIDWMGKDVMSNGLAPKINAETHLCEACTACGKTNPADVLSVVYKSFGLQPRTTDG